MSAQNINSLIGFLAKKSLFNSPQRTLSNYKHDQRQKSDISSHSIRAKNKIDTKSEISDINIFRDHSEKNLMKRQLVESRVGDFSPKAVNKNRVKYQPETRFNLNRGLNQTTKKISTYGDKQSNPENGNLFKSFKSQAEVFPKRQSGRNEIKNDKKLNLNYQTYSNLIKTQVKTFQSARIQSAQCLQQLSQKLKKEISNANEKIENFNQKIYKVLNMELANLKQKVIKLVQITFKQAQKNIHQYMKLQQTNLALQMISMRKNLQKQYQKIESLKTQIHSNNWRKAAGQLIASELEQTVEETLKLSKSIEIKHWEFKQLGRAKFSNFQNSLKQIFSLQR